MRAHPLSCPGGQFRPSRETLICFFENRRAPGCFDRDRRRPCLRRNVCGVQRQLLYPVHSSLGMTRLIFNPSFRWCPGRSAFRLCPHPKKRKRMEEFFSGLKMSGWPTAIASLAKRETCNLSGPCGSRESGPTASSDSFGPFSLHNEKENDDSVSSMGAKPVVRRRRGPIGWFGGTGVRVFQAAIR